MTTTYYSTQLKAGQAYEQFIYNYLKTEHGIKVNGYNTREEQYTGENDKGIEIKFNSKATVFNCLYVEVAEKSNPNNPHYVPSGIYRVDNTVSMICGDYVKAWWVDKQVLKDLVESGRFKKHQSATSIGYTIPTAILEEYTTKVLTFSSVSSMTPSSLYTKSYNTKGTLTPKRQNKGIMAYLKARREERVKATSK